MKYLIKFGSEITIKSDGVRKQCIKRLKTNILTHLDYNEIDAKCSGNWDRLVVEVSDLEEREKVIEVLKSISGIGYFSPVQAYSIDDSLTKEELFKEIFQNTKAHFGKKIEGKSFVVRARRSGRHTFKSLELEREIGGMLFEAAENTRVNLHNPDVMVELDVKDDTYYVIEDKITGLSGYPIGFQDKVLSLISGGFDSGVSTQMMMNRGCKVDYLFFNLGGSAHELGVKQVSHYLWKTFSLPYKQARFLSVPFEGVVKEILTKVDHKYRAIVLKRLMLQLASRISKKYYCGLVKGDSIGQVSSQTLKNMQAIDTASDVLVLRPLIGMNKQDIIDYSKKIGTFHFASSMPEYCGVISDKPSVGAELEDVLESEKNIDPKIISQAYQNIVLESLSKMEFGSEDGGLEEVKELKQEVIIDIREPDRVQKSPLSQKGYKNIETIPFYNINHSFKNLDQNKDYLLYCDKGVLSHLHGLYLREKGFSNIKVFRP